ncbi:hypothetical protein [uncultured Methylibium sp.]|uniref:hypothetical protein n=1 Tax=uncultured Methylibium sp. TaxID=381093 RepID=UPI0025D94F74|nr:hypothetical protein [uncultured Methylibium sp.]
MVLLPLDAPALVADRLEPAVADVEQRLAGLAQALLSRDSRGVDTAAAELQRALGSALDHFKRHHGPVPPALRQRLAQASSQVALQRDTLARATAALDRAIDVLIPREAPVYNARGGAAHAVHSGLLKA